MESESSSYRQPPVPNLEVALGGAEPCLILAASPQIQERLVILAADLEAEIIIASTHREAIAKREGRDLGLALVEAETHDWQLAVQGCPLILVFTVRPRPIEGATQVFPIEALPNVF